MHTTDAAEASGTTKATERPVPLWAERVVRLIPLIGLPVCLWRLPIGFDFMMGIDGSPMTWGRWANVSYVLALSLLSETFALLCRGFVRPWGEVVPGWVPMFGGKRVPPFMVIVPGTLGGLLFTALLVDWTLCTFHLAGFSDGPYTNVWWQILASTVSGLIALWGPLVLALTYAYYQRRCRS
ncbi:hypothetical protein DMA15_02830 [Streptomyces sp. WAC 01529]|nr:hypothetical protein DMA15_02830 [Streptomyces sp. WAC 01529]